jgi:hypothetical protein
MHSSSLQRSRRPLCLIRCFPTPACSCPHDAWPQGIDCSYTPGESLDRRLAMQVQKFRSMAGIGRKTTSTDWSSFPEQDANAQKRERLLRPTYEPAISGRIRKPDCHLVVRACLPQHECRQDSVTEPVGRLRGRLRRFRLPHLRT